MKKLSFIIVILVIAGGVYFATKNNTKFESSTNGPLRSMFVLGESKQCTFVDLRTEGMVSTNVMYFNTNGDVRGDFETKSNAAEVEDIVSHLIIKGDMYYSWGDSEVDSTGIKFTINPEDSEEKFSTNAELVFSTFVDLDTPVDYSCKDWKFDESKFVLPTNVNFENYSETMDDLIPQKSACINAGGNYDSQFGECTMIGAEQCVAIGGTFNECASACRNDPSAEMCTLQCVQVCEF